MEHVLTQPNLHPAALEDDKPAGVPSNVLASSTLTYQRPATQVGAAINQPIFTPPRSAVSLVPSQPIITTSQPMQPMQVMPSAPRVQMSYAPVMQPVQMSMPVSMPVAMPVSMPVLPPAPPPRPQLQRSEVWLPHAPLREALEMQPHHRASPYDVERAYYARHTHQMDPQFKMWTVNDVEEMPPAQFGTEVSRVPLPKSWKLMGPPPDNSMKMAHDKYAFAVDLGGIGANSYWKVDTPVKALVGHQGDEAEEDFTGQVGDAFDLIGEDLGDILSTQVYTANKGLMKAGQHFSSMI
jgi:hypothetical protein